MHLKAHAVKCGFSRVSAMHIGGTSMYLYCESLKTLKEASSGMIISFMLCMTHLLLSTFWFRTELERGSKK
jgi:hypothetical protein